MASSTTQKGRLESPRFSHSVGRENPFSAGEAGAARGQWGHSQGHYGACDADMVGYPRFLLQTRVSDDNAFVESTFRTSNTARSSRTKALQLSNTHVTGSGNLRVGITTITVTAESST
jgi:hypothetical protein